MNYECQGAYVRVWPKDFVLSVAFLLGCSSLGSNNVKSPMLCRGRNLGPS